MLKQNLLSGVLSGGVLLWVLTGCSGPNTSAGTSTNTSEATSGINITRTQYVNAMNCAADKAAPGSKFRFKSQATAYDNPASEASFNNAMGASDGNAKYMLYTQALSLGCTG